MQLQIWLEISFWDDEFRPKWDPMLAYFKMLEECPHTGTTIVHWIKKFPFFCSDREYIIGRRIWEAGKAYYCVTKGIYFLIYSLVIAVYRAYYLYAHLVVTINDQCGTCTLQQMDVVFTPILVHWSHPTSTISEGHISVMGLAVVAFSYSCSVGVAYPALQKRDKPRRVDLYFSSWVIKPVQSRRGDEQSACEVTLVHYEDMGIPKDVAKLGVRHGMWGTVKKLHSGFRAYQQARQSDAPLSRCALMARITTKIPSDDNADTLEPASSEEDKDQAVDIPRGGEHGGIDWKWIVLGGTAALVCGLHTGTIGRALLFRAGQRIARR
ncbi:polyketide cyclase/dehydrase and lipid transport superfamily protein [Actinidia rufa]|uniref:Polyketide cyclase/dehydrase and lipid transport superfamily protein n=1 Tax=Actinidia rufa TaxID=165716 RepID=A0A7J0GTP7_9ERIC|nr:polyketide cyclase/dehydrase and lipid transport superfamily protein [Actinidia rufa]